MSNDTIINIAILAHVDAGKTTITEQLLYQTDSVKKLGNVDEGTASSDFLAVERQRGISVMSSHTSLKFNDVIVNLIDTPGHADFISEVKRSLLAVDAVVLLVSAADGVQAQTKVLWNILRQYDIPTLIVVNKVDRLGVILEDVVANIQNKLRSAAIPIQLVNNADMENIEISSLRNYHNHLYFDDNEIIIEYLAGVNDEILELYLQSIKIPPEMLLETYYQEVKSARLYPIMFTIAKYGTGIRDVLFEIVASFMPSIIENIAFSAIVFKVSYSKDEGRLCFLRVFSGILHKKQIVRNASKNVDEKVNLIKGVFSNRFFDKNEATAGEIIAVTGFDSATVGDVLGELSIPKTIKFDDNAVLTVEAKPRQEQDYYSLSEALTILNIEDPLLYFKWYKNEKEFHLKINGWIQMQILEQILNDRFNIDTVFQSPSIIYKETPSKTIIAHEEYTMPKPCWAVIKLQIEPGKQGSGVVFSSEVGVNDVLLKYQKEVERIIPKALEQGIKGWEVTDLKITLIAGEDHVMHSRAGDFVIATPMAIMKALQDAGTDLLEPIMEFEIIASDQLLGQISSDLYNMRGEFSQPDFDGDSVIITGKIPAATSLEYPIQLASRSGGKASIQMKFCCYRKVETELGMVRNYRGISPLDRSKYILQARNAIK